MFQHLLVPLDGSRLAEAVLPLAASLAVKAKARVTLLHVIERDAPETVHGERHLRQAADAERYLATIAETLRARDLHVSWHVHEPSVVSVPHSVVDHSDEFEPDLVVLAEHGAHRTRDWVSGSIAQRIVSRGSTPVLLVRGAGASPDACPFKRILVPLDGHTEHEAGLVPAKALARASDASLSFLTVVPTRERLHGTAGLTGYLMPSSTQAKLDAAVETAQGYLADIVAVSRDEGLDASGFVTRGDPLAEIRRFSTDRHIDTIAIGTHGKAGTEAFWRGSLAQRLIRASVCSLLLTPVGSASGR